MRRSLWSLCILLALAVPVAGCGGGNEATTAPAAEANAASAQPAGPLDEFAARLRAAGFEAQPSSEWSKEGDAEMQVAGIEISYMDDLVEAATEIQGLREIAANHPQTTLADSHDKILMWIANQNGLTTQQRAIFAVVSKIASNLP